MRSLLFTFLILALFPACKTSTRQSEDTAPPVQSSDLTREDARARKARLDKVAYDLSLSLNETDSEYSGKMEMRFELKDATRPLRVDFYEGRVLGLRVNDQPVAIEAKKPYWIELPSASLKAGANRVVIDFTQTYSKQGQGLHRFVDSETKQVFLYSQFETFDANRFMPCFDQPDLRASLTLQVEAPEAWTVISTSPADARTPLPGQRSHWTFQPTPAISTYLFSLHAGPYQVWTDSFEDIPLRLFVRPALAKYAPVKEWFKVTKQGLKYYNSYFGMRYPFKKYDQVIVPEFNAGAMENVAAVTFSERFLSRGEMTREQRRRIASVLLHEMAHMWFGDIVTMKWWNDLWLNESFASYMAASAMAAATEYKESWQDFFADDKVDAYWEDGLVTTHPIEAPVNSVKEAFATFDGITYGKGASVLKQLNAYMGPKAFQKGLQTYFTKHAYQNAELTDFIAALQPQTGRDLTPWAELWLRQSGVDKLTAKWTCEGEQLTQIDLVLTPSPGARLRPQTVQVALFDLAGGKLQRLHTQAVELSATNTTVKGHWSCPKFVYPNYQDNGYVQVSLDSRSLAFAKDNVGAVSDTLLRTMVWDNLWQMVRATEMPLKDYVAIVQRELPTENDPILLGKIVDTVSGRREDEYTVLYYWPQSPEAQKERLAFIGQMEMQYLRRLNSAKSGSDEQKFWFDAYLHLAQSPAALQQLSQWGKRPVGPSQRQPASVAPGFSLDPDRQWGIVRQLTRYQHPEAPALLSEMKASDASERGVKEALAVEAINPDLEVKRKWVHVLKQSKPAVSFAEARTVTRSLFPVEQRPLAKYFDRDFYEYLQRNGRSEDEIYVDAVATSLSPLSCEAAESTRMRKFIDASSDKFAPSVAKLLKVDLQEDERCQRIRAFSAL